MSNEVPGQHVGLTHVGADIWAEREITVKIPRGQAFYVSAVLRLEGGRYVIQELTVTRKAGGPAVTGELLRSVPVQTIIRGTIHDRGLLRGDDGGLRRMVISKEERARLANDGPTDETLLCVARLYIVAQLISEPPAKTVKDQLGIPTSTAGLWIRRAKDKGFMDAPQETE